jgi:conjugal transfer pilus assembly protein TraF
MTASRPGGCRLRPWRVRGAAAAAVAGWLLACPVAADTGDFFEREAEGWFWYHDPREADGAQEPDTPPVVPPAPEAVAPEEHAQESPAFSVAWLRKLDELRDRAIDEPSDENVAAYMYAQRVMMDKADNFAERVKQVVETDPLLDENNRFPFAVAFRAHLMQAKEEAKQAALRDLATRAGLLVFFRSDCRFCHLQVPGLRHLAERYGFIVKYISLDGRPLPGIADYIRDAGQAGRLRVSIVPTLVLAIPSDTFVVVSQGYLAQTSLENRLLVAAEKQGLIPERIRREMQPESRGVLTAKDLEEAPAGADPGEWVAYLRRSIGASAEP